MRPASFRGVEFKIDDAARGGGRRQSLFEFPKRDKPYAEDMGRRARKFGVTGYLLGPDYDAGRDDLIDALEQEGSGQLVHYLFGEFDVSVDTYSVSESRQRGGFSEVSMQFVEAGEAPDTGVTDDTSGALKDKAEKTSASAASSADEQAKSAGDAGVSV
jgi:prophage DNA circulation protein